jgi:hypothetical protein
MQERERRRSGDAVRHADDDPVVLAQRADEAGSERERPAQPLRPVAAVGQSLSDVRDRRVVIPLLRAWQQESHGGRWPHHQCVALRSVCHRRRDRLPERLERELVPSLAGRATAAAYLLAEESLKGRYVGPSYGAAERAHVDASPRRSAQAPPS